VRDGLKEIEAEDKTKRRSELCQLLRSASKKQKIREHNAQDNYSPLLGFVETTLTFQFGKSTPKKLIVFVHIILIFFYLLVISSLCILPVYLANLIYIPFHFPLFPIMLRLYYYSNFIPYFTFVIFHPLPVSSYLFECCEPFSAFN